MQIYTTFAIVSSIIVLVYDRLILFNVHHITRRLLDEAIATMKITARRRHVARTSRQWVIEKPRRDNSAWSDLKNTIQRCCLWSISSSLSCFVGGISVHAIARPVPAIRVCAMLANIVGAVGLFDVVYISFMVNSVHLIAEQEDADGVILSGLAKVLAVPVSDALWSLIWLIISALLWGVNEYDLQMTGTSLTRGRPQRGGETVRDKHTISNVPSAIWNATLSSSPSDTSGVQSFASGPWWMYAIPSFFILAAIIRTIIIIRTIPPWDQILKATKRRTSTVELEAQTTSSVSTAESTVVGTMADLDTASRKGSLTLATTVMSKTAPRTVLPCAVMTAEPEDIAEAHAGGRCLRKRRMDSGSVHKAKAKKPHAQRSTSLNSSLKVLKKDSLGKCATVPVMAEVDA